MAVALDLVESWHFVVLGCKSLALSLGGHKAALRDTAPARMVHFALIHIISNRPNKM